MFYHEHDRRTMKQPAYNMRKKLERSNAKKWSNIKRNMASRTHKWRIQSFIVCICKALYVFAVDAHSFLFDDWLLLFGIYHCNKPPVNRHHETSSNCTLKTQLTQHTKGMRLFFLWWFERMLSGKSMIESVAVVNAMKRQCRRSKRKRDREIKANWNEERRTEEEIWEW